jgi:hypothetical protein
VTAPLLNPDPQVVLESVLAWLAALPPIQRAQAAGMFADPATSSAFAAARRGAIYEATRTASHDEVAAALGVSPFAVNKAITEHNRAVRAAQPPSGAHQATSST